MFNIGDYIMYGKTGVCQIAGIETGRLSDKVEMEYYILQPVYKNKTAVIKTPVNNQKVHMRQVASREEILILIDSVAATELEWIVDDKYRSKRFDQNLSTGTCHEWMKMIKLIYLKKRNRMSGERNVSPRDLLVLKEAKRLLHEEFALALEIDPEGVEKFIINRIENKGRKAI